MEHVFLSRRNLLTLLSKLDRRAAGEDTACAIVKNDHLHRKYPQTMDQIKVFAVEDDEYYDTRGPGRIHPADEANVSKQYDASDEHYNKDGKFCVNYCRGSLHGEPHCPCVMASEGLPKSKQHADIKYTLAELAPQALQRVCDNKAELVREQTNAPIHDCKKALVQMDNNVEAAVKYLTANKPEHEWDQRGWEPN